jgi:hypothetical protein
LALEKSSKENLVNDIENKLDDFFNEKLNTTTPDTPVDDLQQLKSIVLSIDWEITDSCLIDLMEETDRLLPIFEKDRFTHALLRMLNALGRYIQKRKARAHPLAINRVMAAYSAIERLAGESDLADEKRRQLIANEIAAFKKLKRQVEAQRLGAGQGQSSGQSGSYDQYIDQHKFKQAMEHVEKRLNGQVADLKSQIDSLQKEIDSLRGH